METKKKVVRSQTKPHKVINQQKQNIRYNLNLQESKTYDNNFSQKKNSLQNDSQTAYPPLLQKLNQIQSQQKKYQNNQQIFKLNQKQNMSQNQNQNQNLQKFNLSQFQKNSKLQNLKNYFGLQRKNNFNSKFKFVYVVIILSLLLLQPTYSQAWTKFDAVRWTNTQEWQKIKLSQDQKIAVTIDWSGNAAIWSVGFPYLRLLQEIRSNSGEGNYGYKAGQIFIWNNGQRIFVCSNTGILSIYQRNADGITWTKNYNVYKVPYDTTNINNIVVNNAGTKIYVSVPSHKLISTVIWSSTQSNWYNGGQIWCEFMQTIYNVYVKKDQSQMWVHGFKQFSNSNGAKNYRIFTICVYNKDPSYQYLFSHCIDNSNIAGDPYNNNEQFLMNVSPNQKLISWDGTHVSNIAVYDAYSSKFTYIKTKSFSSNFWSFNYIDSSNYYLELNLNQSSNVMTMIKTRISYSQYSASYASLYSYSDFSQSYSMTRSPLTVAFSKDSNFAFVSTYQWYYIYSIGIKCGVSNCNKCDPSGQSCQQTGCATNYQYLYGYCCQNSASMCNANSQSTECYAGYYLNPTSKLCYQCPVGCDQCKSSTVCTSCATYAGYILSSSSQLCVKCSPYCTKCKSQTQCQTCKLNFQKVSGQCACTSGYNLDYNSNCNKCLVSNCNTCLSSLSACTTTGCATGFKLIGNNCCQLTATSCTSSSQSTGCISGYFPYNSACTKCPNGCLTCDNASKCTSCIASQGYIISSISTTSQLCVQCSANCVTCSSSTQCQTCKSTFSKVNGQCVCIQGYYLAGSSCAACQSRCKSCTDGTSCTACKDVFSTLASNCQSCGENYFLGTSQTCQFCDPTLRVIVPLRTSTALRKSCAPKQEIKQIPNCEQYELVNNIYQCKTCISGSTKKTNVLRGQQVREECILKDDIQKAKPQCTQFRASANNHYCTDCAYPFSIRHVPNIQNRILFQCIEILTLEYENNCRTSTGQSKPCSQCDASSKRVAKVNMEINKNPVSSFIKLITPKCTIQESPSYCTEFVCSTDNRNI